jgi:hypothetical protein
MNKGKSKELEPTPPQANDRQGQEAPANGKGSGVRIASKRQFDKAHRKTSAQHAGLFRRLAK